MTSAASPFLFGGHETGLLAQRVDWAQTALGAVETWPQALRTAVSLVMRARQPMLVAWGPQLVTLYNDAYIAILGSKHPAVFAQPMSVVWAEVWDIAQPINEAVMRGESLWFENMPFELAGRGLRGTSYFDFSYTPLLDESGAVAGLFCAAVETTAAVVSQQQKHEEVERQRRLFEQAPGFICTLRGPDHVFDFTNATYQRLFARTDMIGKTVREVFPELQGQGYFELLDQVFHSGERYTARDVPARLRQPEDGTYRDYVLDFIYAPIVDETGEVVGIFCEGHDVTESHRSRRLLEEREQQLRLATEHAEIGLWDVDVVGETLFWPARVKAMFGISADAPVSMRDFYEGLHPDDRTRVSEAFAAACDASRRALYDVEYRTVGKEDGRLRWVAAKGRALFDPPERCVRVIGTAIDITARKAMEEAQREADQRKDEFIATLSHELRNPLAPLRSAVSILKFSPRAEREARLVDMMDRQLGHLVRLVDDLLELSRISRGAISLRCEVVDLGLAVEAAVEATLPAIEERQQEFVLAANDGPLWVHGDPVRLAQLIGNLVSNAARYTPKAGSVRVEAGQAGDRLFVKVQDSGRGFTPEERERMFDMFVRSSDSPGLGIGLALAGRLAELHAATIEAESPGPGRGATFTVWLPAAIPPSQAQAGMAARAAVHQRVLIVDDNLDAADSLRALLEIEGVDVRVSTSGAQALEEFERWRPDTVLLDIGMPGMDGYEVARRLRATHPGRSFRVVGLSGWGQEADRARGRAAGFDDHLVKPVELDALRRALGAPARDGAAP